jgi:hypothetical protein
MDDGAGDGIGGVSREPVRAGVGLRGGEGLGIAVAGGWE